MYEKISTNAYKDQKPGTSGLRKRVEIFQQPHYVENYIQSIFNALGGIEGKTLILGGDGRYYNDVVLQKILLIAAANKAKKIIVGQNGILSTPAISNLIRKRSLDGGILLTASHNPAGVSGDFGIKYNIENGSAAPVQLTDKIYEESKKITHYEIFRYDNEIDLSKLHQLQLGDMHIDIIDPVQEYADLMEEIFDFQIIREAIGKGLDFYFDAMHAVTGIYGYEIFHKRLGVPISNLLRMQLKPDFGGTHPDPMPGNLPQLIGKFFGSCKLADIGGACDGDGDRNLIIGRSQLISPSDSLAILLNHIKLLPYYSDRCYGVARSMPTSRAVDLVAEKLKIKCYETPTGWKFFGNLLDAGQITLCGEESFGTGSLHTREKDGIWAILYWLYILAKTGKSAKQIVTEHWQEFGRHYYIRCDYENLDSSKAESLIEQLRNKLSNLNKSNEQLSYRAEEFSYYDIVDGSVTSSQGFIIYPPQAPSKRIICRQSGTGTSGATLRVYLEQYVKDRQHLFNDAKVQLKDMITEAEAIIELEKYFPGQKPDNIV